MTLQLQYRILYCNDPRLPSNPARRYADEWRGWAYFFKIKKSYLYTTYKLASSAARRLKIKTESEYRCKRSQNPRLPSNPDRYYADWISWPHFLRNERPKKKQPRRVVVNPYTMHEAMRVVRNLGIKNQRQNLKKCIGDPRLPSSPHRTYAAEWKGDHYYYNGVVKEEPYGTLKEAKFAAQALGIKTSDDYKRRYKDDPKLPSSPDAKYDNWISWPHFLHSVASRFRFDFYTFEDARIAARGLNCTCCTDYNSKYTIDPRLPSNPDKYYANQWKGFPDFLGIAPQGIAKSKIFYSFSEARVVVKLLCLTTQSSYRTNTDQRLPSAPHLVYANEWVSWPHFLGTDKKRKKRNKRKTRRAA